MTGTSQCPELRETTITLVADAAPWVARRVRDLARWAARQALPGTPRATPGRGTSSHSEGGHDAAASEARQVEGLL
jgi:hypothetical protein